jgi:histidinol-phosphate aminotransferase
MREFAFDLRAMARAVTGETRIIYLANPNNPTGSAFSGVEFEEFLRQVPSQVLVVLDEAYIHYGERSDMPRSVELSRLNKNLVILRTFSKVYGLAGLRVGYAVSCPGVVSAMNKLRTPFNTSGVSQAAALAALDDAEHVKRSIETNARERARLLAEFQKLGLRAVRSHTNFIFIDVGPSASALQDELLREGVIVRPLGWMGLPQAMRITVGTREENDKLLAALGRCLQTASEKAS